MSDTLRTDDAAISVWRRSDGTRMETKTDEVPAEFARQLERELAEAKAQRDRLVEAIRKHKSTYPFAPDLCDVELYEVLAEVKGDKP